MAHHGRPLPLPQPPRPQSAERPLLTDILAKHQAALAILGLLGIGGGASAVMAGFASKATVASHEERLTRVEVKLDQVERSSEWQNDTLFHLATAGGLHPTPPPPTPVFVVGSSSTGTRAP